MKRETFISSLIGLTGLEMPEMRPRDAWDDPSDGANANEGGDDEETASGPGLEKES